MGGDDAHVARRELYNLNLARGAARKDQNIVAQTTKTKRVVACLKLFDFLRRRRELVEVDAVEQHGDDVGARQTDALDRGALLEREDCLVFALVPDDDLEEVSEVVWMAAERHTLFWAYLGLLPPPTRAR